MEFYSEENDKNSQHIYTMATAWNSTNNLALRRISNKTQNGYKFLNSFFQFLALKLKKIICFCHGAVQIDVPLRIAVFVKYFKYFNQKDKKSAASNRLIHSAYPLKWLRVFLLLLRSLSHSTCIAKTHLSFYYIIWQRAKNYNFISSNTFPKLLLLDEFRFNYIRSRCKERGWINQ